MNTGHTYSCCKDYYTILNEKQVVFKRWTKIQLYAVTNIHGLLTMTANDKNGHFSSYSSGFRKILAVVLPRQAENDRAEEHEYRGISRVPWRVILSTMGGYH